jgi:hypothetical protein
MSEFFIRYEVTASRKRPKWKADRNFVNLIKLRDIVEGKDYLIQCITNVMTPSILEYIDEIYVRIQQKHKCEIDEIDIININKI